ncbi:MAG: alpha-amylase family protein [Paramuribaculum sp.]|nr:alpha-amylase family protein [Paramuribaculum sp.]
MEKPIIYQLLPRLFTNCNDHCRPDGTIEENGCGKLNEITDEVLADIRQLGATHVWYTGVLEHATATDYSAFGIRRDNPFVVKGKAGSPYAIKDYYDIDPDLAVDVDRRREEFDALVARTHAAGMKVVMDFVPNHLARQYNSDARPEGTREFGEDDDATLYFRRDNNFYYIPRQLFSPHFTVNFPHPPYVEFPAKATGNDCFSAFPGVNDWYETVKLNYGIDYGNGSRNFNPVPDTWYKMLHILRHWAARGIDAFRCDMAHMVPVEFWQWAISNVKRDWPEVVFIAEIYDVALYRDFIHRGGFDYLYDKVTLYDTLRAIECSDTSAACLTNCWQTVGDIRGHMLNFLENHDEQRFASTFYAGDGWRAIPSLVVASTISTCPMMVYAGQELGEKGADAEGFSGLDGRTTIFDYWSIPTLRRRLSSGVPSDAGLPESMVKLRQAYARILTLASTERAVSCGEFFDLMYVNYNSPGFNPHRHYTYLRHYAGETLLIAVNFGFEPARGAAINLPDHAFDYLGIAPGDDFMAEELLGGERIEELSFTPSAPFLTDIPAKGAVVWKIQKREKTADDVKKPAPKSRRKGEKQ